jgi:hypothetical protein
LISLFKHLLTIEVREDINVLIQALILCFIHYGVRLECHDLGFTICRKAVRIDIANISIVTLWLLGVPLTLLKEISDVGRDFFRAIQNELESGHRRSGRIPRFDSGRSMDTARRPLLL